MDISLFLLFFPIFIGVMWWMVSDVVFVTMASMFRAIVQALTGWMK
jgi:hypothetical protein